MPKRFQQQLIGDIVRRRVAVHPSRTALVWRDLEMSYLELDGVIDQVATGFRSGVKSGDRVALLLHNTREFVFCYYALARLGVVAVPLNVLYSPDGISFFVGKQLGGGRSNSAALLRTHFTKSPRTLAFTMGGGNKWRRSPTPEYY